MQSKFIITIIFSLVFFTICYAQENTKEKMDFPILENLYLSQAPPSMTPEIFAPGIVSSPDSTEYGIAFSPDAKEFYFNSGSVGVKVCRWNGAEWTAPEIAPFFQKI